MTMIKRKRVKIADAKARLCEICTGAYYENTLTILTWRGKARAVVCHPDLLPVIIGAMLKENEAA